MKTCKKGLHQYDQSLRQCPDCKKQYQELDSTKEKNRLRLKTYWAENKHRLNENKKEWKSLNQNRLRELQLIRHYGISMDQFNQMFSDQNGCCGICNTHQSKLNKVLSVDHDHETGKIRSLLCDKCNRGLGFLNDNPDLLKRASDYVLFHKGDPGETVQARILKIRSSNGSKA